jgi:hypothetical protein
MANLQFTELWRLLRRFPPILNEHLPDVVRKAGGCFSDRHRDCGRIPEDELRQKV